MGEWKWSGGLRACCEGVAGGRVGFEVGAREALQIVRETYVLKPASVLL